MREYSLPIDKAFQQGLRIDSFSQKNAEFLSTCVGCRTSEFGVVPEVTLNSKFDVEGFPFPQLFRGQAVTLLCGETEISTVSELTSPWEASAITVYDAYDAATPFAISADGVWHFVDFYNVWLLFNGTTSVFKTNIAGMFGETNYAFATDDVTINTGCSFRGRALFGGFDPSSYSTPDWNAFWQHWLDKCAVQFPNVSSLGWNFVSWTTIGGGDLLNVFYPDLAVNGVIEQDESRSINDSMLLELWQRNELGFMPMPSQGAVLCVKPLGNGVVVYSEDGVVYLPLVSSPVPTFGMHVLPAPGIVGRGAVGGDDFEHIFIDPSGDVWALGTDLKLQRLRYKNHISSILEGEVTISLDKENKDYYISGENTDGEAETYILSKYGLSKSGKAVNSCVWNRSELIGICSTPGLISYVSSDIIDFGIPDIKTVGMIEIEGQGLDAVYVSCDYRYDSVSAFTTSDWIKFNAMGFAYIGKSAKEFRINLKSTNPTTFAVQSMSVKWKASGKRTIRRIYAGPNVSRTRGESLE